MAHPLRSVTRAALGGLVLGLMGAAFIFAWSAWKSATEECQYPDTEQCISELETADEISRLRSYASVGCGLLASGLYLLIRRR